MQEYVSNLHNIANVKESFGLAEAIVLAEKVISLAERFAALTIIKNSVIPTTNHMANLMPAAYQMN